MKTCEACGQPIRPNDPGIWTGDGFIHGGYPDCPRRPLVILDCMVGQALGWLNRRLRWWERA